MLLEEIQFTVLDIRLQSLLKYKTVFIAINIANKKKKFLNISTTVTQCLNYLNFFVCIFK